MIAARPQPMPYTHPADRRGGAPWHTAESWQRATHCGRTIRNDWQLTTMDTMPSIHRARWCPLCYQIARPEIQLLIAAQAIDLHTLAHRMLDIIDGHT
jgi:hypothetical protein